MPAVPLACPELRPYTDRDGDRGALPVNRDRYRWLQPESGRLVRDWFARGAEAFRHRPDEPFEPFIFVWIAVNAWAACVTGADTDASYVYSLQADEELQRRFDTLRQTSERFAGDAEQLHGLMPLLKAQAVRRAEIPIPWGLERQLIVERLLRDPRLRDWDMAPACARRHLNEGGIPMDWPHVLAAVYRVRCNLFHGEKAVHIATDRQIVSAACGVLIGAFEAEVAR